MNHVCIVEEIQYVSKSLIPVGGAAGVIKPT